MSDCPSVNKRYLCGTYTYISGAPSGGFQPQNKENIQDDMRRLSRPSGKWLRRRVKYSLILSLRRTLFYFICIPKYLFTYKH
jgi:hypothetical protein